jgi:repressor LexA
MTALGLTPRQAECLGFIRRYIAENNGASPTRREICAGLGMKSASDVHQLLQRLKERGHIDWAPRRSRAITLLEKAAA